MKPQNGQMAFNLWISYNWYRRQTHAHSHTLKHTHEYCISNSNFTEIVIALFCLFWILLLFVFIIIKQYENCVSTDKLWIGVHIVRGGHCTNDHSTAVISYFFGLPLYIVLPLGLTHLSAKERGALLRALPSLRSHQPKRHFEPGWQRCAGRQMTG